MKISKGIKKDNVKIVIYGEEGVGKTTFANLFPAPINLDIEDGSKHLDIARVEDIKNWEDILQTVKYLLENEHEYKTLILDTADWLEKLCDEKICKDENCTSVEDLAYGTGYGKRRTYFGMLLNRLNALKSKMNIIFLAHSKIEKIDPPQNSAQPYDHISLKCSKQVAPLLKEWCDALLFMAFDDRVEVNKQKKAKAVGGQDRVMYTQHTAFCDAKNRFGLEPLIYADYAFFEPLVNSQIQKNTIQKPSRVDPLLDDEPQEEAQEQETSIQDKVWQVISLLSADPKKAEALAVKYFATFKWINEGEDWRKASNDNLQKILERPQAFIDAVKRNENAQSIQ